MVVLLSNSEARKSHTVFLKNESVVNSKTQMKTMRITNQITFMEELT